LFLSTLQLKSPGIARGFFCARRSGARDIVRVGLNLNYRFNWGGPVVTVLISSSLQ